MPNSDPRGKWLKTPEGKERMKAMLEEVNAIEEYLAWLDHTKKSGVRRSSRETIERRIAEADVALAAAGSFVERVNLVQRRADYVRDLAQFDLEAAFIKVVDSYSKRKHIEYATWREMGVPARVLSEGGVAIPRSAAGGLQRAKNTAPRKQAASKSKARTTKKESEK